MSEIKDRMSAKGSPLVSFLLLQNWLRNRSLPQPLKTQASRGPLGLCLRELDPDVKSHAFPCVKSLTAGVSSIVTAGLCCEAPMPTICIGGPSKQKDTETLLRMEGARRPVHLTFHDLHSQGRDKISTCFSSSLRASQQCRWVWMGAATAFLPSFDVRAHSAEPRCACRAVSSAHGPSRRTLSFGGSGHSLARGHPAGIT